MDTLPIDFFPKLQIFWNVLNLTILNRIAYGCYCILFFYCSYILLKVMEVLDGQKLQNQAFCFGNILD